MHEDLVKGPSAAKTLAALGPREREHLRLECYVLGVEIVDKLTLASLEPGKSGE